MKSVSFFILYIWYLGIQIQETTYGESRMPGCEARYDKFFKMMVNSAPEVQPEFQGGRSELYRLMGKELNLTSEEWEDIGKFLMITFLVDSEGKCRLEKISDHALQVGKIKEKAQRFVEKMPPWKPGKCKGKAVPVKYYMQVRL